MSAGPAAASGEETIFALATAPADRALLPAALAVVRLSGSGTRACLNALAGCVPAPRRASLSQLCDETGALLDEAIVLFFPAAASATGEDAAELQLHGSPAVIEAVLAALARRAGLRRAEPGEFAWRSWLAGRTDLARLEGLADLMAAESEAQRVQALAQLQGGLASSLGPLQEALTGVRARLAARLEFPDDLSGPGGGPEGGEEEEKDSDAGALSEEEGAALAALQAQLEALQASAEHGERVRLGAELVLFGPANAGKSSLFNALLGREAAIVSSLAGTTRDVLPAPLRLAGRAASLSDTAGLGDAPSSSSHPSSPSSSAAADAAAVENEAERRAAASVRAAAEKGVGLLVLDLAGPPPDPALARRLQEAWQGRQESRARLQENGAGLLLGTKSDLVPPAERDARLASLAAALPPPFSSWPRLKVSAREGEGLSELARHLVGLLERTPPPFAPLTRPRHREEAGRAAEALARARRASLPEARAAELDQAAAALARIVGGGGAESVLDALFAEFCIGK